MKIQLFKKLHLKVKVTLSIAGIAFTGLLMRTTKSDGQESKMSISLFVLIAVGLAAAKLLKSKIKRTAGIPVVGAGMLFTPIKKLSSDI